MSELLINEHAGSVTFEVRVIPRSSKSEIVGLYGNALKIRLTSPPVEGAANNELLKLLSRKVGVSRSAIEIISGQSAKTKRIRIIDVTAAQIRAILKAKS
jgi:uncharacterized protein (TIGR00251 family)